MTSTCSAAATGLPFDRRHFMTTLASAGALTASAGITAAAVIEHPDRKLLGLVERLVASDDRRREFDRQIEAAWDLYDGPDIPDALAHRDSDYPRVCFDSSRCAGYFVEGETVLYYEGPEDMTLWVQRWWTEGDAYANRHFTSGDRARATEIKLAYEAWQRDIKRAEDAAGITEPGEAAKQEEKLIDQLLREIVVVPATTVIGVAAKARAAAVAASSNVAIFESHWLPHLLADPTSRLREALSTSLIVDAAKLGNEPTSDVRRRA